MSGQFRFICVLKSGGCYTEEYVLRLFKGLDEHAPHSYTFTCLSDVGHVPLNHDWPGWWSKIEAFRFTGPCLYLDLDTIVRGPIETDCLDGFVMLQDFLYPKSLTPYGSGVMFWDGDYRYLYERFKQDPELYMREYRRGGDQRYIYENLGFAPKTFQEIMPGKIVSRKVHKQRKDASIICYHGKPRPHETGWAE